MIDSVTYDVGDKLFYKVLGTTRLEIESSTVVFKVDDASGTVYGVINSKGFFLALQHSDTIEPDKYLIHLEIAAAEKQVAELDKKIIHLRKELI